MPASPRSLTLEQLHRQRIQAIARRTAALVADRYDRLDVDNLAASFRTFVPVAAELVASGQRDAQAATAAFYAAYAGAELGAARATPTPRPGIAGTTVDGRPLRAPLAAVVPATYLAIKSGRPIAQALGFGRFAAIRIAGSETSDASWRELLGQLQSDPTAAGWTWVSSGRSCGACLAQADNRTRPATQRMGRHAGCDCTAAPVMAGAADRARRPTGRDAFNRMTPEEQAATFRSGGAEKAAAIRAGQIGLEDLVRVERHAEWRATITEASLADLGLSRGG
jgi:hypothetical protein